MRRPWKPCRIREYPELFHSNFSGFIFIVPHIICCQAECTVEWLKSWTMGDKTDRLRVQSNPKMALAMEVISFYFHWFTGEVDPKKINCGLLPGQKPCGKGCGWNELPQFPPFCMQKVLPTTQLGNSTKTRRNAQCKESGIEWFLALFYDQYHNHPGWSWIFSKEIIWFGENTMYIGLQRLMWQIVGFWAIFLLGKDYPVLEYHAQLN